MNLQSIGDLAQTFKLRQQNVQLKQQMSRLTQELSSGRASDVTKHLSGNFGHLGDVEHDLVVLSSFQRGASTAATSTLAMQSALENVQSVINALGSTAVVAGTTAGGVTLETAAEEGRGALDAIISALNTEVGGRSLFSGTDIEATPLASADVLLNEVRTAVAAATSASDIVTALDTFFDTPGGGFETLIYQGGTTHLSPVQLGEGQSVALELRADDTGIRSVLKNVVMAALVDEPTVALSDPERQALAKQSGERLFTDQDELTEIRSSLGFAQSRIEQSMTRIASEMTSLEIARTELLSVDNFKTATELETVQIQLETLYTLTARASRFSLVNFL